MIHVRNELDSCLDDHEASDRRQVRLRDFIKNPDVVVQPMIVIGFDHESDHEGLI